MVLFSFWGRRYTNFCRIYKWWDEIIFFEILNAKIMYIIKENYVKWYDNFEDVENIYISFSLC